MNDPADILFRHCNDEPQVRYLLYHQEHGIGAGTYESAGMYQPVRDNTIERSRDSQIRFEILLRPYCSLNGYAGLTLRLNQRLRRLDLLLRLNELIARDRA